MWIRIVTKEGTVWWQNGDALFIFPPLEITLVSFQTSVRFNITVAVKVSMTLLLRQYLWLPQCMVCEMRWPDYLRQDLKELTFSIIPVSHPSHQVPICRVFFFFSLYDFSWPPAAAHGTCLLMALVVVPMANMTRKIKSCCLAQVTCPPVLKVRHPPSRLVSMAIHEPFSGVGDL